MLLRGGQTSAGANEFLADNESVGIMVQLIFRREALSGI
jgi:hypothetical protein